ncbi:MAG: PepSY domain-containing protein [Pseudomonadota bacterium]|jgi:uncharacterized membrane protein YkoI
MKPFRKKAARLAVCAAAGIFAAGAAAQTINDAGQAIGALQAAGYTTVRDVELDDGLWEAEVKGAGGRWHDVHVDPASGAVIDRMSGGTLLTAGEITERLKGAGYTSIHELDLDEAVWDAEAVDTQGQLVEVRVNAFTGAILSSSVDH